MKVFTNLQISAQILFYKYRIDNLFEKNYCHVKANIYVRIFIKTTEQLLIFQLDIMIRLLNFNLNTLTHSNLSDKQQKLIFFSWNNYIQ